VKELRRRLASAAALVLAAGLAASAGDEWKKKAPGEWAEKEVVEFLSESPWAKEVTVWQLTGQRVNRVVTQDRRVYQDAPGEVPYSITRQAESVEAGTVDARYGVRWVSATVARQAWERLRELNPALAEQFAPPEAAPAQHVLTLRVVEPPPEPARPIFAGLAETELVKRATLRTSGKRTLAAVRAARHGTGAAEAVSFFFAREENGQATLPVGTDWAEFSFESAAGDKLKVKFKLREMQVSGKPDY